MKRRIQYPANVRGLIGPPFSNLVFTSEPAPPVIRQPPMMEGGWSEVLIGPVIANQVWITEAAPPIIRQPPMMEGGWSEGILGPVIANRVFTSDPDSPVIRQPPMMEGGWDIGIINPDTVVVKEVFITESDLIVIRRQVTDGGWSEGLIGPPFADRVFTSEPGPPVLRQGPLMEFGGWDEGILGPVIANWVFYPEPGPPVIRQPPMMEGGWDKGIVPVPVVITVDYVFTSAPDAPVIRTLYYDPEGIVYLGIVPGFVEGTDGEWVIRGNDVWEIEDESIWDIDDQDEWSIG